MKIRGKVTLEDIFGKSWENILVIILFIIICNQILFAISIGKFFLQLLDQIKKLVIISTIVLRLHYDYYFFLPMGWMNLKLSLYMNRHLCPICYNTNQNRFHP